MLYSQLKKNKSLYTGSKITIKDSMKVGDIFITCEAGNRFFFTSL